MPAAQAAELTVGAPVLDLAFEGSVADSSASAHPTQLKGRDNAAPQVSYGPGSRDGSQAITFGGNTYLDLGASTKLLPTSLSLSFWVNPGTGMSGEQIITWNKGAYNSDGFYVSSVSNTNPLLLSVGKASGTPREYRVAASDRASFFPANAWTHIVVTFDEGTKATKIYRNGAAVDVTALNGNQEGVIRSDAAVTKTIGYNGPNYNGSYIKSSLDDYRLYSGVATIDDVVSLFEEGGGSIDKKAVAEADVAALTLPETASIALALPSSGSAGSKITWTSSNESVISSDGIVTPPTDGEDVTVTLTAKARFAGGASATREFPVTVVASQTPASDSGLEVLLSDDYLTNAASKEHEYLLSMDSKKFLYWFYRTAGLTPPTSSGYGGWENGNVSWNFRGHAFGHYMSALAMSYASTQDATVKQALRDRITDAVAGLEQVQNSYAGTKRQGYVSPFRDTALDAVEGRGTSDDQVIVPYYNLHKVLAGLLDIDKYVPGGLGDRALTIAEGFGEYMYGRISTLPNKQTLLNTEYGGMNEALYELFARSGGNPHFKVAAEGFDEVSLFQQLADNKDVLNGKHANTQIPKFIGALKRYTVFTQNPQFYAMLTTQEKQQLSMYRSAAENFWRIVVDDHTYATGANSQSEHFHAPDQLWKDATQGTDAQNAQTAETCNEYNMLKLTREMFKLTQDVNYANYYENTFINTILSSQNPETGMTTYFQAMAPGFHKVYGAPITEFWCCIGTGMENFSKLSDSIYFTKGSTVWVNMFFSSQFDYAQANLRVAQEANLPNNDTVTFTVSSVDGGVIADDAQLRLRVPDWIVGQPTVRVNGAEVTPDIRRGYVVLSGLASGDVISYTMPLEVKMVSTADNADFVAFRYGPVLLSTGLGSANMNAGGSVGVGVRIANRDPAAQQSITVATPTTAAWKDAVLENVVRIEDTADGQVQFELRNTKDGGALRYTPHFQRHDERYGLYMTLEVPDSPATQAKILADKQRLRDSELFIDSLSTFDNNNAEASKNRKSGGDSSVGSFSGRTYRHAQSGGWFSYDLEVDPSLAKNFLRTTYYSGDNGRSFDVYLNDTKLKTERITNAAGSGVFYEVNDEIPRSFLEGNAVRTKVDANGNPVLDANGKRIPVVTVRLQSTGGLVGGLFGIATTGPVAWDTTSTLTTLAFSTGTLSPEFASGTTSYVLTVPEGTQTLSFEASPARESGLVKVGDILIDDTVAREVELAASGDTTLTLNAFAQDHTTYTAYTVVIRRHVAPALDVTATSVERCVAGKVVLAVSLSNASGAAASAKVVTPFGTRTVSVAAGTTSLQAFSTRTASIEAGAITGTATATVGGKEVSVPLSSSFAAKSCR